MGAEEQLPAEVEGIPALASGMPLGDVEGLEVVPLGFDLRAQLDLVAERLEHGLDLPADLSQDMDVAALERRAGKGDIDRLGLGEIRQSRGLQFGSTRRQRALDGALGLVGCLA